LEVPDDHDRGIVHGRGRRFRAPVQQVPGHVGRERVWGRVGVEGVARAAGFLAVSDLEAQREGFCEVGAERAVVFGQEGGAAVRTGTAGQVRAEGDGRTAALRADLRVSLQLRTRILTRQWPSPKLRAILGECEAFTSPRLMVPSSNWEAWMAERVRRAAGTRTFSDLIVHPSQTWDQFRGAAPGRIAADIRALEVGEARAVSAYVREGSRFRGTGGQPVLSWARPGR
jgi:hypothetical protein